MLILDLKTQADPVTGKRLLALERFSDAEAELAMATLRVADGRCAAQPPHLCRIQAAALLIDSANGFALHSWDVDGDEAAMLIAIEAAVARVGEPLWVWDGGTPMAAQARATLLARALAHRLSLPALLAGAGPQCLAAQLGFQAPLPTLAELAAVHRLPQRLSVQGAAASACDALLAWLLAGALQQACGALAEDQLRAAQRRAIDWLGAQSAPHWRAFLAQWQPQLGAN